MVYTKPIITTQGNHSHVTIIVPTSSILGRYVVVEPYVNVHVRLTTRIPSHTKVITKLIPLDPKGNPPQGVGMVK
jgi:hypothetical protein